MKRIYVLLKFRNAQFYVEADFFPYLPFNLLLPRNFHLDYDDAVWFSEKVPYEFVVPKYAKLANSAISVSVGSHYLSNYIEKNFGVDTVKLAWIPTVFEANRFTPRRSDISKDDLVFGWIGSPTTSVFIDKVIDIVLRHSLNIKFYLLGYEGPHKNDPSIIVKNWSEEEEQLFMLNVDVGLSPLVPSDFAMGKCGFKVVQYYAMGLPVIADDFPPNSQFIRHLSNGLLCKNEEDWVNAFSNIGAMNLLEMGSMNRVEFESISFENQRFEYIKLVELCVE